MPVKSEYTTAVSTKAKRAALVEKFKELIGQCDASIVEERVGAKEHRIVIGKGRYRVAIEFAGSSNVGAFLGHWYVGLNTSPNVQYPVDFAEICGGSLNTFHYRKATTCQHTWDGFFNSIIKGLEALSEKD